MKKYFFSLLLSFTLMLYATALQAQCAMCRASLESNISEGEVASMSSRLNLGILYLFVTPYLLFGLVAFFWYRASKKNRKESNDKRLHPQSNPQG